MVALLSELDAPLSSMSPLVHNQYHRKHRDREIDFFEAKVKKVDKGDIKGFSFDSDIDSFYDVKDISKDLYLESMVSAQHHQQRHQKKQQKTQRHHHRQRANRDVPNNDNNKVISAIVENFDDDKYDAEQMQRPTPWQDLVLYAILGILLLVLLDQVFRLGIHVATIAQRRKY